MKGNIEFWLLLAWVGLLAALGFFAPGYVPLVIGFGAGSLAALLVYRIGELLR
jgi:hypothetical protein